MAATSPTPEEREVELVQLAVFEERLADARRSLGYAAGLRVPRRFRSEALALAALAAELHRAAMEATR
jgi:hypothetical protein